MFAWFQRLLPERGDFFGMFEAHAAMLVAAAEALQQLSADHGSTEKCLRTIQDREHVADDVIRDVLTTVRKTFLTPFTHHAYDSHVDADLGTLHANQFGDPQTAGIQHFQHRAVTQPQREAHIRSVQQ